MLMLRAGQAWESAGIAFHVVIDDEVGVPCRGTAERLCLRNDRGDNCGGTVVSRGADSCDVPEIGPIDRPDPPGGPKTVQTPVLETGY